jgi:hypothetical protein
MTGPSTTHRSTRRLPIATTIGASSASLASSSAREPRSSYRMTVARSAD